MWSAELPVFGTLRNVTADGSRLLILVRHAKSAWPDVPDHERPLAPRGRRQAPLIGAWLHRTGYVPDTVLCSTARRARQTWQLMSAELGGTAHVTEDERIYGAHVTSLIELLRQVPGSVRVLLLVGHDPGIRDLAVTLAGHGSAGPAGDPVARVREKFPTGAAAVLKFRGAWSGLSIGAARLTDFVVPRDLEK
jgi:phosphohistidine phosphatase